MTKLGKKNDITLDKRTIENIESLNDAQYNSLTKDQKEGRSPVIINRVVGYVDGDRNWKRLSYINELKKKGKWQG